MRIGRERERERNRTFLTCFPYSSTETVRLFPSVFRLVFLLDSFTFPSKRRGRQRSLACRWLVENARQQPKNPTRRNNFRVSRPKPTVWLNLYLFHCLVLLCALSRFFAWVSRKRDVASAAKLKLGKKNVDCKGTEAGSDGTLLRKSDVSSHRSFQKTIFLLSISSRDYLHEWLTFMNGIRNEYLQVITRDLLNLGLNITSILGVKKIIRSSSAMPSTNA